MARFWHWPNRPYFRLTCSYYSSFAIVARLVASVQFVDVNVVDDSGRLISFNIEPKISCNSWARHSGGNNSTGPDRHISSSWHHPLKKSNFDFINSFWWFDCWIQRTTSSYNRLAWFKWSWTFDWARMFTMFSRDTSSCRNDVRFAMIKCCQKMSRASFPCVSIMLCFHCRYLSIGCMGALCWPWPADNNIQCLFYHR